MADHWNDATTSNSHVRDDDDDVPDDWENEPEEKPKKSEVEDVPKAAAKAPPTAKNKAGKKKYAGDERTTEEDFLESLKEPDRHYTPEELDELRKRADLSKEELKLNMVSDFFSGDGERNSLDNVNLVSKQEFLDYSFRLYNRLALLSKSDIYPEFLDHLLNGLTKNMSLNGVKRMSGTLQTVLTRKQKEDREGKKTVKPQLKAERQNDFDSFADSSTTVQVVADYDEDNDFM